MLDLYEASEPVDVLTVTDRLRQSGRLEEIGGAATVDELTGLVPAAGHARRYAQIVREMALLRRLLKGAYEIQESVIGHSGAPRDLVEQAEKTMLEVARDDRQKDFRKIEDVLHEELDKLHRLSLEGTSLTGTPSGFKDLDEITGGFQPGNLIIVAARPAMGKSALVCNIAENAAAQARPPRGAVLAGDGGGRAGPALRRLPGPHQRRGAAQGAGARAALAEDPRGLLEALQLAPVGGRLQRRGDARDPRQGAAPAQPGARAGSA